MSPGRSVYISPAKIYVFRDLKCDERFKICIRSHQALGIASCGQELAEIVRRRINKNENRENDRPYSRGQINFAKHQTTINVGNLRVPGLLKTWHESRKYFPFHRHAFIWSLCDHTAPATFTFRNACITMRRWWKHHSAPRSTATPSKYNSIGSVSCREREICC